MYMPDYIVHSYVSAGLNEYVSENVCAHVFACCWCMCVWSTGVCARLHVVNMAIHVFAYPAYM